LNSARLADFQKPTRCKEPTIGPLAASSYLPFRLDLIQVNWIGVTGEGAVLIECLRFSQESSLSTGFKSIHALLKENENIATEQSLEECMSYDAPFMHPIKTHTDISTMDLPEKPFVVVASFAGRNQFLKGEKDGKFRFTRSAQRTE
jgi:hypothetical protein